MPAASSPSCRVASRCRVSTSFASTDMAMEASAARISRVVEVGKDGSPGKPIPNAVLDIWQAKADGIYDLQTEGEFELRGRVRANEKGEYALKSYKPKFYSIPMDGPVGGFVSRTSNNHMRPAHMHAIVSAPGYQQVITHVFVHGDPYLDGDAVFAVKNSLIAKYKKLGLPSPFLKLEWDFHLSAAGKAKARKAIAPSDALA